MTDDFSDGDGRASLARATERQVEGELEEMRDDLHREFLDYERRLRTTARSVPSWEAVEADDVERLFDVDLPGDREQARLGPRLVAVVAGELESFATRWLSEASDGTEPGLDTGQIDEVQRRAAVLSDLLRQVDERAEDRAEDAVQFVEQQREASLERLEEEREETLSDIESRVREGELEPGTEEREERARAWDRQRTKASETRAFWTDIEDLIEEGRRTASTRMEGLRDLFDRAVVGLRGARPELSDRLPEPFDSSIDVPSVGGGGESSPSSGSRPTVPVDVQPEEEEGRSRPGTPGPESAGGTGEAVQEERASAHEGTDPAIDVASAQPSDPAGEHASGPATRPAMAGAGSSPEPAGGAEGSDEGGDASRTRRGETEESGSGRTADDPGVGTDPEEPSDDGARGEGETGSTGRAIRLRTTKRPVPPREVLYALGPPAAVIVGVAAAGVFGALGLGWLVDPVLAWSWIEPVVAVAAIWCVFGPVILDWRPRLRGWRPLFARDVEVREEAELNLEEDGMRLDDRRIDAEAFERAELRRWGRDGAGEMFGWLLALDPPGGRLSFVAPASDLEQWQASHAEVVEPPGDAWQIESDVFGALRKWVDDDGG